MKKIYSIVLMATALLIGTNAWAKDFSGNAAQLQKAIADIIYGDAQTDPVIKLQNDVELNGTTIWVGTENLDDASYKTITIDLNGHSITSNSQTATSRTLIALTHGELKIINTAANEATLGLTGSAADGSTIVSVYGSYRSSRWNEDGDGLVGEGTNTRVQGWCSHLEIGSNVKLYAEDGCQGTGLYVGPNDLKYPKADGTLAATAYPGWVMTGSIYSFTHGVRVDFYGKIDFQGTNNGKAYGIKANGTLRSPLSWANSGNEAFQEKYTDPSKSTYIPYIANYSNNNTDIDKNATLATDATHKRDTVDAPFIWIHPGAEVNVRDAGTKVTALYAAGYAKWLVQGYAEGKTGMYVSSGVMDLNDAYVKSTAAKWESSTSAGSANGGGSGVVINSRDSYSGGVEFTVSGDSHIESIEGYAIEEIVNTTAVPNPDYDPTDPSSPETIQVTKVADITIEGGTITGGDEGAIVVSTATLKEAETNEDVEVVIYGGNVIGDSYAGDKGAVTTGNLSDLMPNSGYHTTEVTDESGKTIIVVSKGDAPDEGNMVSTQASGASVKWTINQKDTIKTTLKLAELEINTTGLAQELVIKENATLEVGRVVLGKDARIVVEAGAKFIVTGTQGIVAPVAENIVLKASETAQATFLFNPSVNSNRHPNATVELISKSYYEGGKTVYQRFGIPTYDNNVKLEYKNPASAVQTYITYWDYAIDNWDQGDWIAVPAATGLTIGVSAPFACLELVSNNVKADTMRYLFKGALVGNDDAAMTFNSKFNPYANSFMAPIDIETFLNRIAEKYPELTASMYVYTALANDNYTWTGVGQADFTGWDVTPAFTKIAPMQAYMLYLKPGNTSNATISYKDNVYDPYITGANHAPARHGLAMKQNFMKLSIADENGIVFDNTRILEDNQFSEEFDNGYDINKFMNDNVSIYVTSDNETWHTMATDDIMNAYIGVNVAKSGTYTINVAHNGLDYALVDTENNQIINMVEGNTYSFYQETGKNDTRFQIVKINNVPTAIDDVQDNAVMSTKIMKDGVLYIIKNGAVYNAQGQIIK